MLIARTQQRSERNEVKNTATSHQIKWRQSVDDLRREMSVRVFAVTRNVAYNTAVSHNTNGGNLVLIWEPRTRDLNSSRNLTRKVFSLFLFRDYK